MSFNSLYSKQGHMYVICANIGIAGLAVFFCSHWQEYTWVMNVQVIKMFL